MNPQLLGQVRQLLLYSFSLDPFQKKEIAGIIPNLPEEKLLALKELLEQEEQKKNEMIARAVEAQPELADRIQEILRRNTTTLYRRVEDLEKPFDSTLEENLLTQL